MTLVPAIHHNMLIHILKDIYTNTKIGPLLGFKGGTAAYLFYDLSRFSVDLDFDLLDDTNEDAIFESIQKILQTYGTIKDARKKRYSLFFLLSYDQKIQDGYNIKIEINRRNFGSRYEVKSYLGIAINVMVQADMAAHKLVAMLERAGKANRDIYDVWFLLKNNWAINENIIKLRTNMTLPQFTQKAITTLESINTKSILSGLGELLDAKQKAWVKAHLVSETIFLLRLQCKQ